MFRAAHPHCNISNSNEKGNFKEGKEAEKILFEELVGVVFSTMEQYHDKYIKEEDLLLEEHLRMLFRTAEHNDDSRTPPRRWLKTFKKKNK